MIVTIKFKDGEVKNFKVHEVKYKRKEVVLKRYQSIIATIDRSDIKWIEEKQEGVTTAGEWSKNQESKELTAGDVS